MTNITGKIYQETNDDGTENRFPKTVVPAVIGLSQYLQDQFNTLSDLYMPKEGESESKTGQEITYRKSPKTIKAKTLTIDRIKGKTLAWNQQVRNYDSWAPVSGTKSISNGILTYTVSSAVGGSGQYVGDMGSISNIANHKYYIRVLVKTQYDATIYLGGSGFVGVAGNYGATGNTWNKFAFIRTASSATTSQNFYVSLSGRTGGSIAVGDTMQITSAVRIDLTLMFGAGNEPSTVEEFEAMFPGYHDYSAGKLISNDAESIETVGFNQWDEKWRVGYYNTQTGAFVNAAPNGQICCKNPIRVIGGSVYNFYCASWANKRFCYYDANMNFISSLEESGNGTFTVPAGASYLNFHVIGTNNAYNHDICINLSDPAKNGTYEPYRKFTLHLGLNNIRVKSHNIWDEEWDNGSFSDDGVAIAGNYIRSKNFLSVEGGETYYINKSSNVKSWMYYYDANGTFIPSYQTVNTGTNTFIAPARATKMKFLLDYSTYGRTYNHDICINLSSSFNGMYEAPGILTIDGLKGSGTWRDELFANKYIKKALRCNMGDWSWNISSTTTEYYAQPQIPNRIVNNHVAYVCSKYTTGNNDSYQYLNIQDTNGGEYRVRDKHYWNGGSSIAVDAATFKSDMNGVMIDVELATPIEYELAEPLTYTFKAGTTEERVSPNSDGLSAPFCCDLTYNASETAGVLDALQGLSRKLELIEERLARLEDN